MTYATVRSCTMDGVTAVPVTVEVHLAGGLPGMSIVGLPQSAVRESRERVRAAIEHIGLRVPQARIIINLAPADLPKQGGRFDLPIALGILAASRQLPASALDEVVVIGELGLSGELRAVRGVLPAVSGLSRTGKALLLPVANLREALHSKGARVHAMSSLDEVVALLLRDGTLPLASHGTASEGSDTFGKVEVLSTDENRSPAGENASRMHEDLPQTGPDLAEVRGQQQAREALEVAAAGGHNLLMCGSPGSGKTLLARCLPGILPPLSETEALEVAAIESISHGGFRDEAFGRRPFRAPHHSASVVALVGGASPPMPGEISLAHRGVLFLDELPEFSRAVLESLREPLDSGVIQLSRAAQQAIYPAEFQLLAAMNPCPCGHAFDDDRLCRCNADAVARYRARVSGPLLDRFDLQIAVMREITGIGALLPSRNPDAAEVSESSATVRLRVIQARKRQLTRQGKLNARLETAEFGQLRVSDEALALLAEAAAGARLSLRAQHRLLRVARTLADLAADEEVNFAAMAAAIGFRALDEFH
ncbi:MAG: ATP-dependent protease [Gammaproteobacteria bacterium]|nr:MAG: ATP-dependent protease [Gammaproteobacteria bacterium]PIE35698.1 MAG: ATP-dependent protease [Gammaproteobacteria bacterium]